MNNEKLREAAQRVVDRFFKPAGVYQPIDHTDRREFESSCP